MLSQKEIDYWNELNKMYGTNIPVPQSIELDMDAVEIDMALGDSFDGAVQRNLIVVD